MMWHRQRFRPLLLLLLLLLALSSAAFVVRGQTQSAIDPVASVLQPTAPLDAFHDVAMQPAVVVLVKDALGRAVPFATGCLIVDAFDDALYLRQRPASAVPSTTAAATTTTRLTSSNTTTATTTTTTEPSSTTTTSVSSSTTTVTATTASASPATTSTSAAPPPPPPPPPPASSGISEEDRGWVRLDAAAVQGASAAAGTDGILRFARFVIATCSKDVTRIRVRACPSLADAAAAAAQEQAATARAQCAVNQTDAWIRKQCSAYFNVTLRPHPARLRIRVFPDANRGLYTVAGNLTAAVVAATPQPTLRVIGGQRFAPFAAVLLTSCGTRVPFSDALFSTSSFVDVDGVGVAGETRAAVSGSACTDFPGVACALFTRAAFTLADGEALANFSLGAVPNGARSGFDLAPVSAVGTFRGRGDRSSAVPVGTRLVMLTREQIVGIWPLLFGGADVLASAKTVGSGASPFTPAALSGLQQAGSGGDTSSNASSSSSAFAASASTTTTKAAAAPAPGGTTTMTALARGATTTAAPTTAAPKKFEDLTPEEQRALQALPFDMRGGVPFLTSASPSSLFGTATLDVLHRRQQLSPAEQAQAAAASPVPITEGSAFATTIPMARLQEDFVVIAAIFNVSAFADVLPPSAPTQNAQAPSSFLSLSSSSSAAAAAAAANPATAATTTGGTVLPSGERTARSAVALPAGWNAAANGTFGVQAAYSLRESPRGMLYAVERSPDRFLPRRLFGVVERDAAAGTTSLLYVMPFTIGGVRSISSEIEEATQIRVADTVFAEGYRQVRGSKADSAAGSAADAAAATTTPVPTTTTTTTPLPSDGLDWISLNNSMSLSSAAARSASADTATFTLRVEGAPLHMSVMLRRVGSLVFWADPEISFLSAVIQGCDCTVDQGLPLDYGLSVFQLQIGEDRLARYLWGALVSNAIAIVLVFVGTFLFTRFLTLLSRNADRIHRLLRCCVCAACVDRWPTCARVAGHDGANFLHHLLSRENVATWNARIFPHIALTATRALYPGIVFVSYSLMAYLRTAAHFGGWFFGAVAFPLAFPLLIYAVGQRFSPAYEDSKLTRAQVMSKPFLVRLVAPLGVYQIRHVDSIKWRISFEDYRGPRMRRYQLATALRWYLCCALPGLTFIPCRWRFLVPFLLLFVHCSAVAALGPLNRPYLNFWAMIFSLGTMLGLILLMWGEGSDRNMQRILNAVLFGSGVVALLRIALRVGYYWYCSTLEEGEAVDTLDTRFLVHGDDDDEDDGFVVVGSAAEKAQQRERQEAKRRRKEQKRSGRQRQNFRFNNESGFLDADGFVVGAEEDEEAEEMRRRGGVAPSSRVEREDDELSIEIDLSMLETDHDDDDDEDEDERLGRGGRDEDGDSFMHLAEDPSASDMTVARALYGDRKLMNRKFRVKKHSANSAQRGLGDDDDDDDDDDEEDEAAREAAQRAEHTAKFNRQELDRRNERSFTDFAARRHLLDRRQRAIDRRAAEIQAACTPGLRVNTLKHQQQALLDGDEGDRGLTAAQRRRLAAMTDREKEIFLHDAIEAEMRRFSRPMPPAGSVFYAMKATHDITNVNATLNVPRVGFPDDDQWKRSKATIVAAQASIAGGAPPAMTAIALAAGRTKPAAAAAASAASAAATPSAQLTTAAQRMAETAAALALVQQRKARGEDSNSLVQTTLAGRRPEEVEFVITAEDEERYLKEKLHRQELRMLRRRGPKLNPALFAVYAEQQARPFMAESAYDNEHTAFYEEKEDDYWLPS